MLVSLKVFHHDMSHGSVWEVMVLFLICICGMNFPFTKRRACFYLEVVNFLIQSIQSHIVCPHIINKYEHKTKEADFSNICSGYLSCTLRSVQFVFVMLKTHVAKTEVTECPLEDKLCNVNTTRLKGVFFFFFFRLFLISIFGHYKCRYW